jgi:hypothetical protein
VAFIRGQCKPDLLVLLALEEPLPRGARLDAGEDGDFVSEKGAGPQGELEGVPERV